MVGGLVFGYLADRFGRKPIMLFCLYLHIVIGVALAYIRAYYLFVILRFFMGVLMQVSDSIKGGLKKFELFLKY